MQGSELLLTSVLFADVDAAGAEDGHAELRESFFEATFSLSSSAAAVHPGSVFLDKSKLTVLPGVFVTTDIFVGQAGGVGFAADPQGSVAFSTGQSRIKLKGTLAELNGASKIVSLRLAPQFVGKATLTVEINDLGCCSSQGTDAALSASVSVAVEVVSASGAPVVSIPAPYAFVNTLEDQPVVFSGIQVTDVGATGGTAKRVRVTISSLEGKFKLLSTTSVVYITTSEADNVFIPESESALSLDHFVAALGLSNASGKK